MNKRRLIGIATCVSAGFLIPYFFNACSHHSVSVTPLSSSKISFYPPGGPVTGGNSLTIHGVDFNGKLSVQIAGTACPVTSVSNTQIVCTVPAGTASWAEVRILSPFQSPTTLGQNYAYGAVVVGQTDFSSYGVNYSSSLTGPTAALAAGSSFYISDTQAGRVTIYSPIPSASATAPSTLLGQSSLSGTPIAYTSKTAFAMTMGRPSSMCTDGTQLMIADSERNRVLVYSTLPGGPSAVPSLVLGQKDFLGDQPNQGSSTLDGTMLSGPRSIYCDGTNVVVADSGNNRVLIWNQPLASNGQAADLVLGQTNFALGAANQGTTASATTLSDPRAVAWDSTDSLFLVGDAGNERVLIWTAWPSSNDQAAALALGPGSLTNTSGGGCAQGGISSPAGLAVANGYLYIADSALNRIQAWDLSAGVGAWTNGQTADLVFGQTSFTTCTANQGSSTASLSGLRQPTGLSASGTSLFVADTGNNRVLIYNTAPTTNSPAPSPDINLGQSSASAVNPARLALGPGTLGSPHNAIINGGVLYVADPGFSRVLAYNPAPVLAGSTASYVLGQPDMVTAIANTLNDSASAQTLSAPRSLLVDGAQKLYVSDSANNRVLLFAAPPTANAPAAATVIGQSALTTAGSGTAAAALHAPADVCSAEGQLFVADSANNRVLVYSSWNASGGNGQSATYAIGQSDLTSTLANAGSSASARSLSNPEWLTCNSSYLFVSDLGNQRVLAYTLPIGSNGPAAALVLGQKDFVSTAANQGASSPTASTVFNPHGLALDGSKLYLADGHNHRLLIWRTLPTANGQAADSVYGQSNMTSSWPNASASAPSISTLFNPLGLSVSDGRLVISDGGNSRILIIPEP